VSIRTRRPPTSQPQQGAKIDWSNPLTRGLVVAAYPLGNRFFDAVTQQFTTNESTRKVGQTIDGNRAPAIRGVGSTSGNKFANPTGADVIDGTSPWSLFTEVSPESDGLLSVLFSSTEPTLGNGFSTYVDDANYFYNSIRLSSDYNSGSGATGISSGTDSLGLTAMQ